MTVLSDVSIEELCQQVRGQQVWRRHHHFLITSLGPLITPFSAERHVVRGKSWGLSACTYDCRIAQDLVLPRGTCRIASTIEQFNVPIDVCGSVLDKSTWARVFVSAFNTHLDPGWCAIPEEEGGTGKNHLTLELANLSDREVVYEAGDPVCQVKFEWLDRPSTRPYRGKYLSQPDSPVHAIYEGA